MADERLVIGEVEINQFGRQEDWTTLIWLQFAKHGSGYGIEDEI
jgi:hypothetical protein